MATENPDNIDNLVVGGGVNETSVEAELKDPGYYDFVVADSEGYGRRLTD